MNKNKIVEKINNNFYDLEKAYNTLYHGKVFVVATENRIKSFHKTKRGAEGKVKKDTGYSYFDEYYNELVYPSAGEVYEIKESELNNFNNAEVWEKEIISYMGEPWRVDNIINDHLEKVTNIELKKVILEQVESIKKYEGVLHFAENFKTETIEVIEEVKTVEEVKETEIIEEKESKIEKIEDVKIVMNEEKNGIELYFNNKPSEEVRNNLKSHGFRWSRYNKCWYAKQSEEVINFANSLTNITQEEIKVTSEQYKEEKENEIVNKLAEINIDDIESYTISEELSKRENSNGFFRSKDIDHNKEIQDSLLDANNLVLEVLKDNEDISIEYSLKMALQRFKRDYYNNYVARITHKANNPSWAITGRSGRSASKDQKMNSRYDKLLSQSNDIIDNFNKQLRKAEKEIKKNNADKLKKEIEEGTENITTNDYNFKRVKKDYNLHANNYIFNTPNHNKSMLTLDNEFFIFKNWGCYRVYNAKGIEIYQTKTTGTIEECKKWLIYFIENKKTA